MDNEELTIKINTLEDRISTHHHTGGDSTKVWAKDIRNRFYDTSTSFPTDPFDGQKVYRTDLGEEFYYDSTRSSWLSTAKEIYQFSRDASLSSDSVLACAGGVVISGLKTYYIPYTYTVVGMTIAMGNTPDNGYFGILHNNTHTAGEDIDCDGTQRISDITLNFEHTAGSMGVKFYYDSESATDPVACVHIRRRAT